MAMTEGHKSNAGRYVIVYICILAIAGLQFVIAYSNITAPQMFARMLFLAVIEAALPGLLRDTPVRGAELFLSLAVECVSRCGAKGEIAEVAAMAARGGSSQAVKNARLLCGALR